MAYYMTAAERRRESLESGIKCAIRFSDHAQLVYLLADPESKAATQDTAIALANEVDRAWFALERLGEGTCHG